MKKFLISLVEIAEVALVAAGTVFLIRSFLFQPFLVSGASMVPNFSNGDYLLVDELTYRVRLPERGEVVVFRYPRDPSTFFIKRIVGLPGEKIEVKDGAVTIYDGSHPQGFVLNEPYLLREDVTTGNSSFTLGENQYFVMGDNRSFSFDSRSWGFLERSDIIGLARVRLWPVANLQAFAAPTY